MHGGTTDAGILTAGYGGARRRLMRGAPASRAARAAAVQGGTPAARCAAAQRPAPLTGQSPVTQAGRALWERAGPALCGIRQAGFLG